MHKDDVQSVGSSANWEARGRRFSLAAGVIVLTLGGTVLAGWLLGIPVLKSLRPDWVSMKANTALCFLLAGAGLALLSAETRRPVQVRLGQLLGLLVLLIGGLSLCEQTTGWNLGIDELIFRDDTAAVATAAPGRMALSSAINFVLMGLALLWIEWEPQRGFRPSEMLSLAMFLLGLYSVLEYASGQALPSSFILCARMAMHTAIGFLILSTGVLLSRPALGIGRGIRGGRIPPLTWMVFATLMLLLFLIVLTGGLWFYHAQEKSLRQQAEEGLEVIARMKADGIAQCRAARFSDARELMDNQFFKENVARWLADPQADLGEKIRVRLCALSQNRQYDDFMLVDARGQVRLRSSGDKNMHLAESLALASAIQTRQPVLTDLHKCSTGEPPNASLVVPLVLNAGPDVQPGAVVILRLEASRFFSHVINSWPTSSRTAETLFVRRDGDSVLFLNDVRHAPNSAFRLRIPLTQEELPAAMAVTGREGVFYGTDYRGVRVLSVVMQIPDTGWGMVVKIDEKEVFAAGQIRASFILAIILLLLLALISSGQLIFLDWVKRQELLQASDERRLETEKRQRGEVELQQSLAQAERSRQAMLSIMEDQKQAETELLQHRENLEELVAQRTAELASASSQAQAANRAKSVFLSNMSHELRTPLTAVLGFTELMSQDRTISGRSRECLDIVSRSGEHLLRLINDILDISKIEAGQIKIDLQDVDLHEFFRDVVNMMRARTDAKGLRLVLNQSSGIPRFAATDPGKLRQIIINLAGNAIKFTKTGQVTIGVAAEPTPSGHLLSIEVQDTGIGIAKSDLERIFLPFEQSGTQKAMIEGTGLGLAITRQYVQMLGGTISVDSELGKGSCFHFAIPVGPSSIANAEAPLVHCRPVGIGSPVTALRILIVEDQANNRLLLRHTLEEYGFQLREAVNGEEAVAVFQEWRPDLVFMDRRMPVMDGLEATRRIKALPEGRDAVIVEISAHAFLEDQREMLDAGYAGSLSKPFRREKLLALLGMHLHLDLVYAEETEAEEPIAAARPLTADDLRVLPPAALATLLRIANECDDAALAKWLETQTILASAAKTALANLLKDYRFDVIIELAAPMARQATAN